MTPSTAGSKATGPVAPSLRRQLAIRLSIGITLLWILALASAAWVVRHELDEVFDSALQETAERILPLAVRELIAREDQLAARVSRMTEHEEFLTYVVRNAEGRVMLQSHDVDLAQFTDPPRDGFRDTEALRIFSRSAVSGAYVIEVAEPLIHRRKAVLETMQTLFVPGLLLFPVSLLGIFWFVGRALRPVDRLRTQVTRRSGTDLRPVDATGLPQEVEVIALAVNQLLERLTRTLEAERSFTANSAHELRTPIAAGLAQAQRLIAEAPAGALTNRARQIEAQLQRLARLSEKLMQLARAEGGGVLAETPSDLSPVLAFVVEEFRRAGHGDRLHLSLPENGVAPSRMDPDAFGILARNLIENALRYGDPAAPVEISMQPEGGLRVANAGPVVPADQLAQLTQRFARGTGASARTGAAASGDGAGLGLAIVETIAQGAGAQLRLNSPRTGHKDGFEALLVWP